jgi:Na+/H+ antiporter 1
VIPSQPQRATTTHGVENPLPDRGRDRGRYRRHHGGGDILVRPALRVLDAIHDRQESPAAPLLRHAGAAYSGLQLIRGRALARIGFTVSLFIAGQALPRESDFMAAKFAVLGASVVSAVIDIAVLWSAGRPANTDEDIVQPNTISPDGTP